MKPIYVFEFYHKDKDGKKNNKFVLNILKSQEKSFLMSLENSNLEVSDKKRKFFNILRKDTLSDPRYIKYTLETTNYIGIYSFGENSPVIIRSKFNNIQIVEMLKYSNPKYYHFFKEIAEGISNEGYFFEIIIKIFENLMFKLLRTPIYRDYFFVNENRVKIKGKILLYQTISKNILFQGKCICEYSIFSPDNAHNQIIKWTLFVLLKLSPENINLKQFFNKFNKITLKPISKVGFSRIRYNRFNIKYREIHNFCRIIIENTNFGTTEGDSFSLSLLFNVNTIYESFLRNFIRELLKDEFFTVEKRSYENGALQPDIVIEKNKRILLLCDAKYKFEYNRNDYREMLDYMTGINQEIKNGALEMEFDRNHRNAILIYPLVQEVPLKDPIPFKSLGDNGTYYKYFIDLSKINDSAYKFNWIDKIRIFLKKQNNSKNYPI